MGYTAHLAAEYDCMPAVITEQNRKWWTLATVCFGLLMIVLDSNVVNLALPKILVTFHATLAQLEWINNAYLLVFAVFLITFGRLGDEIGRKKMFLGGLACFTVGSLLCGISGSVPLLISFRVLQGLGGAAMMPATLSLISASFPAQERGTAMGFWGAVAGLGIALGPILGGYLTDLGLGHGLNVVFHMIQLWRYVFFINLPIGILAFLFGWGVIRESKDSEQRHRFDIFGIVLSALSIFCLTFAFIEGQKYGWWHVHSAFTMFGQAIQLGTISVIPLLFALSIGLAVAFVARERHVSVDPLVDTKLFRWRNFTVGNLTVMILAFGMMGAFFLLPLFLQSILGFSAVKTGTILLPLAGMLMLSAPFAGKLADRFGGKWLIVIGLAVMAAGSFWLGHFTLGTTIGSLIPPFLVIGLAMGIAQAPLTNITLYDIPADETGGASGIFTTTRQIGSVMGIAILGAVLQTMLASDIVTHINQVPGLTRTAKTAIVQLASDTSTFTTGAGQSALQRVLVPAGRIPTPAEIVQLRRLGQQLMTAGKQAFTDSINRTLAIAAGIALLGSASGLLFVNRRGSTSALDLEASAEPPPAIPVSSDPTRETTTRSGAVTSG